MANEGYHESNLSEQARDMHRAIVSLMEELEAVDTGTTSAPRPARMKNYAPSRDCLFTDNPIVALEAKHKS